MPKRRSNKVVLFDPRTDEPVADFNTKVLGWMDGSLQIANRKKPAAFAALLELYRGEMAKLPGNDTNTQRRWRKHRTILSSLTKMMMGNPIALEGKEYSDQLFSPTGSRSARGQSMVKNTGENFINALVYAMADALRHQDEILVTKGREHFSFARLGWRGRVVANH